MNAPKRSFDMKHHRISAWLLLLMLLMLPACGSRTAQQAEAAPSPTPEAIERTETVNIPESVLDTLKLDITALSRRLELYNVTENIDGSCTVYMTAEEKAVILSALRAALEDELTALSESGTWPFLTKAELSEDCLNATLHTTADRYAAVRDRTCAEAVYLPALLCAAFTQENAEALAITFTVVDENGKEMDTFIYPEPEIDNIE